MQDYEECQHCGRKIRPYHTKLEDHPGTISKAGTLACGPCYHGIRQGTGAVTFSKLVTGTPCLRCATPLRPWGTKVSDHPGTKPHKGSGYCMDCTRENIYDQQLAEALKTGAVAPNPTVDSQGRLAKMTPPPPYLDAEANKNRKALDKYMDNRRRRGVPAEGMPLVEWLLKNRVSE